MRDTLADITIIGAGPVGLFGAFYAGLRGMSVVIVDSLFEAGGQLTALYPEKYIYDMPGFPEILAKDLAVHLINQANRFQPRYKLGEQCLSLEKQEDVWKITTDKSSFETKTIVICAGLGSFSPTKLGIQREEEFLGKGLMYGVQDKTLLTGKRVLVVGGGDSAIDWALNLVEVAESVTLVHRRDGFRAHEESVQSLEKKGVQVRTWEVVTELHGQGVLEAVTTHNKQTNENHLIPCDAITINIGFKSDLGPIRKWGLCLEKNKISVNSKMQTNLPGVFAAGDVCTHEAKIDLIATGVGEVCTAVNFAKVFIDPNAKVFPGHSSDMQIPAMPQ